ncbi:hypothetical protein [Natronobeatus ordinarius]|uniref:hypothetical protein n=1 Tax=Natronobeatus ordinarius TaxID=2963433 RepID=UPI0020CD9868|nr:hypothetical protein [Natronobeatus ordinarius]
MIRERTKAIVALAFAVGLVCGLWGGLLLLPADALTVPTQERTVGADGDTRERPAFYPAPRVFFALTIGAPALAGYYAWGRLGDRGADALEDLDDPGLEEPPATDGGIDESTDADVHEAIYG